MHPIGTFIVELSFPSNDGVNPLYHIALFYLAKKLPSLRSLVIDGGDTPDIDDPHLLSPLSRTATQLTYHAHSSLIAHLKHFSTVTQLRLSHMMFQSFWDFRRFIIAFPELSTLHLDRVDLPGSYPFQRRDGRVPSLLSVPQNLTSISAYGMKWNPLWIWVVPPQTRHRRPRIPHLLPSLTPHEAEAVYKLVVSLKFGHYRLNGAFDWMYNEEHQRCKFINSLRPVKFVMLATL